MNAFWIALSFLTRIPAPHILNYTEVEMSRSVLWYPVVGLLIGALLVLLAHGFLFLQLSSLIVAALVLGVWIIITGALHWDGLADSADAWLAGGDKDKTLTILKDTHCGSAAIVIVGLCLLIFCAALQQVVEQKMITVLLLAPALARGMGVLLLLTTPYVRESGLGSHLIQHLSRIGCVLVILFVLSVATIWLKWKMMLMVSGLSILFLLMRQLMMHRIGGATGDTIGALIVLGEMTVLLLAICVV